MKIVFVSGKYRGRSWEDVQNNIQKAREASISLWQQGYAVFCPHLNTANFDGYCPDSVWLEGDLAILRRCDAIYMLDNWQQSEGAQAELNLARQLGLEIMFEGEKCASK